MVSHKELRLKLQTLQGKPENSTCCDCSAPKPRWGTIIAPSPGRTEKVGAFICAQCATAQRQLGPHVCTVRSINTEEWIFADVEAMEIGGNKLVNSIFEGKLSFDVAKPHPQSEMAIRQMFCRQKYAERRFFNAAALKVVGASNKPIARLAPKPSEMDAFGASSATLMSQMGYGDDCGPAGSGQPGPSGAVRRRQQRRHSLTATEAPPADNAQQSQGGAGGTDAFGFADFPNADFPKSNNWFDKPNNTSNGPPTGFADFKQPLNDVDSGRGQHHQGRGSGHGHSMDPADRAERQRLGYDDPYSEPKVTMSPQPGRRTLRRSSLGRAEMDAGPTPFRRQGSGAPSQSDGGRRGGGQRQHSRHSDRDDPNSSCGSLSSFGDSEEQRSRRRTGRRGSIGGSRHSSEDYSNSSHYDESGHEAYTEDLGYGYAAPDTDNHNSSGRHGGRPGRRGSVGGGSSSKRRGSISSSHHNDPHSSHYDRENLGYGDAPPDSDHHHQSSRHGNRPGRRGSVGCSSSSKRRGSVGAGSSHHDHSRSSHRDQDGLGYGDGAPDSDNHHQSSRHGARPGRRGSVGGSSSGRRRGSIGGDGTHQDSRNSSGHSDHRDERKSHSRGLKKDRFSASARNVSSSDGRHNGRHHEPSLQDQHDALGYGDAGPDTDYGRTKQPQTTRPGRRGSVGGASSNRRRGSIGAASSHQHSSRGRSSGKDPDEKTVGTAATEDSSNSSDDVNTKSKQSNNLLSSLYGGGGGAPVSPPAPSRRRRPQRRNSLGV